MLSKYLSKLGTIAMD